MRQRYQHRLFAKRTADSFFERGCAEKSGDRHLPDKNDDQRLEHLELGVEPVRTVGDGGRRWWTGTRACPISAGEAAHHRRDVREGPKASGARETLALPPAVRTPARP